MIFQNESTGLVQKNRFESPYEFIWMDESRQMHICHFINCHDGCGCEQMSGSPSFFKYFFDENFKERRDMKNPFMKAAVKLEKEVNPKIEVKSVKKVTKKKHK